MKKLILIAIVGLPLMGCASITDYLTPASIPEDAMSFVGVTNKPASAFWGLYSNKRDLAGIQQRVQTKHKRNVLTFQQTADLEGLDYSIAVDMSNDAMRDATTIQNDVVNPVVNTGTSIIMGLLGLGAGGRFLKRKGDFTPDEVEKEVVKAGLQDPEDFKKTLDTKTT